MLQSGQIEVCVAVAGVENRLGERVQQRLADVCWQLPLPQETAHLDFRSFSAQEKKLLPGRNDSNFAQRIMQTDWNKSSVFSEFLTIAKI